MVKRNDVSTVSPEATLGQGWGVGVLALPWLPASPLGVSWSLAWVTGGPPGDLGRLHLCIGMKTKPHFPMMRRAITDEF